MQRILLFDGGCRVCTNLAEEVKREAGGWLTVRSLHDSDIQELLTRARPGWRWEPTLLTVDGERVRVWTGAAMAARLVIGVGPRRAGRIAKMVRRALVPDRPDGVGRRSFLRTAGAGVVALAGLAALPKAAAAAPADDEALTDAEQQEAVTAARALAAVAGVEQALAAEGYAAEPVGSSAFAVDGIRRVFLFYQPAENPAERAGAVVVELGEGGATKVSAAIVSGSPKDLESLTFTPIGGAGDEVQPLGVQEYLGCMVVCLAGTCGATAINFCSKFFFLAAVLACIAAACGSKTPACHRVCKTLW